MLTIPAITSAQEDFLNENRTYNQSIHSIVLHKEGFDMSAPVLQLNSTGTLLLSFDVLGEEQPDFRFTIRHCEADWSTTPELLPSAYISGLFEDDIVEQATSFNTTTLYTHYSLTFPSRNMQPRLSGNYLLIVYADDPAQPDFTCRFMVTEPSSVSIQGAVTQSDRLEERFTHQQLNFKVDMDGFPLMDPKREVKVVVLQNDRWDNALYVGNPRFVRGSELDYSYDENNSFGGGNEFRTLDMKSLRTQSMRIRRIEWNGAYDVRMLEDVNRSTKNYVTEPDINGRMLIKSDDNVKNSDVEADYARVHFSFPGGPPESGKRIYLLGALTNWNMGVNNEMVYNPVSRKYEGTLWLKQGFYNYIYVTKEDGNPAGDAAFTEGNHWETENQYMVLVYLHELGGLYDRLISLGEINSREQ
ncbi:MAG TPA: DUF5103 domain-containing protein [Bacteroidales bacterium]|nr:DUF5103 domain-containing protein [Bacteroidales bacterium]HPS74025.1 DUF5103 domain-containing protein [Bacteroidales bacterium]